MKYSDKIKFCRNVNSDPIYQEYSPGIRCNCYKDVHGLHFLEVMHLGCHLFLRSTKCNDWDEEHMLEWIMEATKQLKTNLGLGWCET